MSTESTQSGLPPQVALYQLATGYYLSHALHLATKWDIAELLKDGPRHITELAAATATHAPSLQRIMRLLASAGVFEEQENGAFALTTLGTYLRAGVHGSSRTLIMMFTGDRLQDAWKDLEYCVRTGEPMFRKLGLDDPFTDPAWSPEERANFDAAMADYTRLAAVVVAAAYDFAPLRTVVDVGGGTGALLIGLLNAHPHLQGIVFDLPHTAERAQHYIAESGLAERCTAVSGDFFKEALPGADAYILKHVIHDWNDERAVAILKNCHRAMSEKGKVLIVEGVYPPRIDQSLASRGAAANDVNMLVMTGGRQRSEAEFRALDDAAGFKLTTIMPTPGPLSIIEGVRV
jgi:hypothetical protein